MVVAPFGFSVGDFISGIQLLRQSFKALSNTNGATARFQQALVDLNFLEGVLVKVEGIVPGAIDHDATRQIQLSCLACRIPVAQFLSKLERFKKDLNWDSHKAGGSKGWLCRTATARKLEWANKMESEVAKLKAAIEPQLTAIGLVFHHEALKRSNIIDERVTLLDGKVTNQLEALLLEIQALRSQVLPSTWIPNQNAMLTAAMEDVMRRQTGMSLSVLEATRKQQMTLDVLVQLMSDHILSTPATPGPTAVDVSPVTSSTASTSLDDTEKSRAAILVEEEAATIAANVTQLSRAIEQCLKEVIVIILWVLPIVVKWLRVMTSLVPHLSGLLLQDNIHIIDGISRPMSLPYQLCQDWDVFRAVVTSRFRGCPGENLVKKGQFLMFRRLSSTAASSAIPARLWASQVRPGFKLAMSMECEMVNAGTQCCPKCLKVEDLAVEETTWIACKCDLLYRNVEPDDDSEDEDIRPSAPSHTNSLPISESFGTKLSLPRPDLEYFTRVHFRKKTYIESRPTTCTNIWDQLQSNRNLLCIQSPCDEQDVRFARYTDLQRHVKVVHNLDPLQLVDCEILGCHRKGDYGFTRRDKMVEHLREVHKEPIPKLIWMQRTWISADSSAVM